MSLGGPSSRWMRLRTSSRLRTTGRRSGRLARTMSSSQGSATPSTSRYRNSSALKRLILGGGGHVPLNRQRAQKSGDVRTAQLGGMPFAVEEDIPPDPGDIRLFRSPAIVADAEGLADAIEQPRLRQHGRHRLADGARARVAGLDGIH